MIKAKKEKKRKKKKICVINISNKSNYETVTELSALGLISIYRGNPATKSQMPQKRESSAPYFIVKM